MPNQVHGAFLHAPCPVPSCPACEPNSGSVLANVSTKAHSSRGDRHCYAIKCPRTVIPSGSVSPMPQPFRAFDYVLCVAAFFLVGIAVVPLMTTWIR
jgi:hypothetical protein